MAFLIAFVFVSIQIYFAYKSLRLRKEEGKWLATIGMKY
jgi:hypothetical protein